MLSSSWRDLGPELLEVIVEFGTGIWVGGGIGVHGFLNVFCETTTGVIVRYGGILGGCGLSGGLNILQCLLLFVTVLYDEVK